MDNWFSVIETGRLRHHELERKYGNPHLIAAYRLKKEQRRAKIRRLYAHSLTTLGRHLEIWGRVLQKKFKHVGLNGG